MGAGMKAGFKGNKQTLPQKICVVCARAMTWRKAWAKNWEQVKYCSDRCRASGDPTTNPSQTKQARNSAAQR